MTLEEDLAECLALLRGGGLTVERLQEAVDSLNTDGCCRQDLLYLQTLFSSVTSPVNGMALIQGGQVVPAPEDPDQWPYASVLDAINDGWRVISFPNLALMMDDSETYGMGCEFILEKIR
jgi:hypothetical protein